MAFTTNSLSDNDNDNDDEMSNQEKYWEELYHSTYPNCVRMTKYGNKIMIKLKPAQEENSILKIELEQAIKKISLLESLKNCMAKNWLLKVRKSKWLNKRLRI